MHAGLGRVDSTAASRHRARCCSATRFSWHSTAIIRVFVACADRVHTHDEVQLTCGAVYGYIFARVTSPPHDCVRTPIVALTANDLDCIDTVLVWHHGVSSDCRIAPPSPTPAAAQFKDGSGQKNIKTRISQHLHPVSGYCDRNSDRIPLQAADRRANGAKSFAE